MPWAEPHAGNRLVSLLSLAVLGGAAGALAQGPPTGPPSPGAAALLLDGRVAAPELARWAELLADPRPLSRATGARLATVTGAAPLVPALVAALDKETEPEVAREEMIALGRLAPGRSDDVSFRAAGRFSGALDGVLARSLALRGAAALALAPRLAGLSIARSDWDAYLSWATGDGREALDTAASAALSTGAPPAWAALLALARDGGATVDEAALVRSLESPAVAIREESYWHLARSANPRLAEASTLAAALVAAPEAPDSAIGVAALGHELAGRALGREPRDRSALIEALPPSDRVRLPRETAVLRLLRGAEREAYGRAVFGAADAVASRLKEDRGDRRNAMKEVRERPTVLRTASDIPAFLAEDVTTASGCRVKGEAWAALEVRYDARAAVEQMGMHPTPHMDEACRRAARVLLLGSLVPGDRPPRPSGTEIRLLPLSQSFLSCLVEPAPATPVLPVRVDGLELVAPRKVNDVRPEYPQTAVAERRQGVVILEALISPGGCVRSAEVLRGVAPDLDSAALRAVAFWRYTPTLLRGVPVPVTMTVTVGFRLN